MVFKLIDASGIRQGTAVVIDNVPCITKSNDISKTGKHGHTKCRIEAISILDGKKKVYLCGGHDKLDSPMINKRKSQILSIAGDKASVMDLESYETLEMSIPEELKEEVAEGDQVEYWEVEGNKIIKRKI